MIDAEYFKEYRKRLGFSNQGNAKKFLSAKDIVPPVDLEYTQLLTNRLAEIVCKLNSIVHKDLKIDDLVSFSNIHIYGVFEELKKSDILQKLNNHGRRPEQVYFSWMRGYVISHYFLKAISVIFDVTTSDVNFIGDDDIKNSDTFDKTPRADIEITRNNDDKIRVEVQSGFQGENDIKRHKVLEAIRIKKDFNISSIGMHFDLFNGQVAFVKLDDINDDVDLVPNPKMEGQKVFKIEQNYFVWNLVDFPPKIDEIL